ncbi:MAG: hypothetical protein ABIF11_07185 [Nitrospirota bacterium]
MILPELGAIKDEYREIKSILQLTNKRIDDINIHLNKHEVLEMRIAKAEQEVTEIKMELLKLAA